MRIMGIDYGDRKVGIALSDLLKITAQGHSVICYDRQQALIDQIQTLIVQERVEKIVIGLPKNMNGTLGFRGEKTMEFVENLKKSMESLEIILWDERLTTRAAQRVMIETGVKRKNKKKVEDKIAAIFILQSYLDSRC